ncbi:hypothetical protein AHAS_Ahas09G0082700 [Arachis hypogaea]
MTTLLFIFINFRILAPTIYIFFASTLPVIVFGEQITISGIIHSIFGGQLLIFGVAEPTIIIHTYLYNFAKDRDDFRQQLFFGLLHYV